MEDVASATNVLVCQDRLFKFNSLVMGNRASPGIFKLKFVKLCTKPTIMNP